MRCARSKSRSIGNVLRKISALCFGLFTWLSPAIRIASVLPEPTLPANNTSRAGQARNSRLFRCRLPQDRAVFVSHCWTSPTDGFSCRLF